MFDVHPLSYCSHQQMISKVDDNVNFNDSHDGGDDRFNDNGSDSQGFNDCLDPCRCKDNGDGCLNQFHGNDDDDDSNDHDDDLKVEFSSLVKTSSTHPYRVCSVLMYLINLYLSSRSPSRRMTSSLDFVIFLTFDRALDGSSQSFVIVI